MDHRRVGDSRGILPWKMFKIQVLGNGISGILKPSQHVLGAFIALPLMTIRGSICRYCVLIFKLNINDAFALRRPNNAIPYLTRAMQGRKNNN